MESTQRVPKYLRLRPRYEQLDVQTLGQLLEVLAFSVNEDLIKDLPENVRQHFREED